MKERALSLPESAPESFTDLCMFFLPRPIHDEIGFGNSVEVMDWIAVRASNQDQYDYAKMLGDLVTEYEIASNRRVEVKLTGLKLLKAIVEQNEVTQSDLAKILSVEQGTVSKIMTGARKITLDHAKKIARQFKVRASALVDIE
jgi:antitoxin component HigA of HigAB toxin-antitoxin module